MPQLLNLLHINPVQLLIVFPDLYHLLHCGGHLVPQIQFVYVDAPYQLVIVLCDGSRLLTHRLDEGFLALFDEGLYFSIKSQCFAEVPLVLQKIVLFQGCLLGNRAYLDELEENVLVAYAVVILLLKLFLF